LILVSALASFKSVFVQMAGEGLHRAGLLKNGVKKYWRVIIKKQIKLENIKKCFNVLAIE